MTGMLISQYVSTPSLISYKDQRYLIMDAPTDANLDQYLKELKKHNVTSLVRTCEPTYSIGKLISAQIAVKVWNKNGELSQTSLPTHFSPTI